MSVVTMSNQSRGAGAQSSSPLFLGDCVTLGRPLSLEDSQLDGQREGDGLGDL